LPFPPRLREDSLVWFVTLLQANALLYSISIHLVLLLMVCSKPVAFNSSHSLTQQRDGRWRNLWAGVCVVVCKALYICGSSACPCSWPGPLVLVGLHDTSLSDHRTSHGGVWELGGRGSFISKALGFSVPNAALLGL
jgi:hypothetical protein